MKSFRKTTVLSTLLLASSVLPAMRAQTPTAPPVPDKFEQDLAARTTVKVLPNGLTLIITERHEAPVFSFYTLVDAGSANDPDGDTGLAHMFEHIAFKGTQQIGTNDWASEKVALDKVEAAYAAYDYEKRKPTGSDPARVESLHATFEAAVADAQKFVVPNQFTQVAEENGAVGLNASTGADSTQYFWSMPSNRLELWAYLESQRIGWPVAREFYKERDVVMEERRMRTDSNPQGRMIEEFLAAAYKAHPYGRPAVGWPSDITQVTATEAAAFHNKYYTPSNIVIAVVGDVDPKTALPLLEKYFGAIPNTGPKPESMTTVEPAQHAERSVVLKETSQPFYLEGYHRPDYRDPDDSVYDAIQDIFSNGRTSRLYRVLVRDQRVALAAAGFSGFPGSKYPGLFACYGLPMQGKTNDDVRTAIHAQLDLMKTTDVSDAELERFKSRARAELLRGLDDNEGLASQLADYQTRYGDWRQLFRELDKINAVSAADIRRVANTLFVDSNRTSARIDFVPPTAPKAPPATPASASKGGAR